MAYSGKYIVKHRSKYSGDPDKVIYRSMWERHAFSWCDNNSNIKKWHSEETVIPYFWDVDKRYHRYFMDLKITFKDGRTILVEIKPEKETSPPKRPDKSRRYINESLTYVKNMNKWKATKISDNVSIGSNATILPVSITENVVIGAGSVVTKDITKSGIYAGNPAKLIRQL